MPMSSRRPAALALGLVLAACATQPQSTQPGRSVTAEAAKTALFDLTKNEDAGNSDWRINGGYSSFAGALRGRGYAVAALTGSSTFSDGSTSQDNNWTNLSNANLGQNVVRWLAGDL